MTRIKSYLKRAISWVLTLVMVMVLCPFMPAAADSVAVSNTLTSNAPSGEPVIVHVPYMLKPGDVGSVFGGNFAEAGDVKVAILPLTNVSGAIDPTNPAAITITPFNVDDSIVQFEIPDTIPYDVWAIWVGNDNGWSKMEYINKAQIFWVSERIVYPGQKLTVAGRNIVNPIDRTDAAKVAQASMEFVPEGGGIGIPAAIYDMTDYTVYFTVPNLKPGTKYEIRYTNGAGGTHGWTEMLDPDRERVTAVDKNDNIKYFDDNYDLNVAWVSDVNTSKKIDVTQAPYNTDNTAGNNATAAVKKAITDLNNAGGGILYFPAGTYILDAGITLGENTVLEGDGPGNTILKWSGVAGPSHWTGNSLIIGEGKTNGIFNLTIKSDIRRPYEGYKTLYTPTGAGDAWMSGMAVSSQGYLTQWSPYIRAGYMNGVAFVSGGRQPGQEIPKPTGGNVLKNVSIEVLDGRGTLFWTITPAVIEDCNIDVSHSALYLENCQRVRIRNNTLKNIVSALIATMDTITKDYGYGNAPCQMNRTYIENNILIGDSINNRAFNNKLSQEDWDTYADWAEVLYGATEHRPADISGEEMLIIGNSIEGTFGDPCSNAGEGVCNQAISKYSFIGNPLSSTDTTLTVDKNRSSSCMDLEALMPGYYYITVIAGPGIGQMRKITGVGVNTLTLTIDKPWDILPTNESVYSVDIYTNPRNMWVNNNFSANCNSGSFSVFCKTYDMTIAGNTITGGAGIWIPTSLFDQGKAYGMPDFTFHSYYLNIYNNYLDTWADTWFLTSQQTTLGPCSAGGVGTASNGTYNASVIYGARVVHNTLLGKTTDPNMVEIPTNIDPYLKQVPAAGNTWAPNPWWNRNEQIGHFVDRFAEKSGLCVSTESSLDFPNAQGEILDGNLVTNTVYGLQMANTAYNTVLRNNSISGNKFNIYDTGSHYTQNLPDTGVNAGVEAIAAINKSALNASSSTPVITRLEARQGTLPAKGGNAVIAIDGRNLTNDCVMLAIFDSNDVPIGIKANATGSGMRALATLIFPVNDTDKDVVYTVKASLDSGTTWVAATNVIVSKAADINGLTVTPTSQNSSGGTSTITVTGTDLSNCMKVGVFDGNTMVRSGMLIKNPSVYTGYGAVMSFPGNTTNISRTYTIKVSVNEGATWLDTPIETVTVAAAPDVTDMTVTPAIPYVESGARRYESTITLTGAELHKDILVTPFINGKQVCVYNSVWGLVPYFVNVTVNGGGTQATARLTFDNNTSLTNDDVYTIKYSLDGGLTWAAAPTATVTVPKNAFKITGLTTSTAMLPTEGGNRIVTVEIDGTAEADSILVQAFDGNTPVTAISGMAGGASLTVNLTFPQNTSTAMDKVYTIRVSADNGATWSAYTATVTVRRQPSGTKTQPTLKSKTELWGDIYKERMDRSDVFFTNGWWLYTAGVFDLYPSGPNSGDYITYEFDGYGIELMDSDVSWANHGFIVSIDGDPNLTKTVFCGPHGGLYERPPVNVFEQFLVFSTAEEAKSNSKWNLDNGKHTLRIEITDQWAILNSITVLKGVSPKQPTLNVTGGNVFITNLPSEEDLALYGPVKYQLNGTGAWTVYNAASGISLSGQGESVEIRTRYGGNDYYLPSMSSTPGRASVTRPVITISGQPQGKTVYEGLITAADTLSITASNDLGATFSYQWYRMVGSSPNTGTDVTVGTNSGTLQIPTDLTVGSCNYYCVVSAGASSVTSDAATVTITADKSTLSAAITAAAVNLNTAAVSVDGSDVAITQDWVTQAVKSAYQAAIDAANTVLIDDTATQASVDQAVADLAAATAAFNAAKAKGTKGILITSVETGNGQANVNFDIKSANGKGYSVYLSETGKEGEFALYSDVNYNSKGEHIKGLTNGVTYWVYIEYNDGKGNILRSEPVILKPSK